MEYEYHVPCLLAAALQHLNIRPGGTYVDATLGGGGHTLAMCKVTKGIKVIGVDRDPEALEISTAATVTAGCGQQVLIEKGNFADLDQVLDRLGVDEVNGVLFDLGVSSRQLDEPMRGFSFMRPGPLDMRMDKTGALTAEKVVNEYSLEQLAELIKRYGEDRFATRIAAKIVAAREKARVKDTAELAELVSEAVPARFHGDKHPATRTFQAIRIEVNGELEAVRVGVGKAIARLKKGGRIVVISYHSLEDQIVKELFSEASRECICPPGMPVCGCGNDPLLKIVTKRPVRADEEELLQNPRCRSAKLRAAERI